MGLNTSRRQFLKAAGAAGAAAMLGGGSRAWAAAASPPAAARTIRFGVQTAPQHVAYADIVDVWREADELGFDSLFAFDHFLPIMSDPNGPCLEGWTLLAALAAQTKRAHVGLLVTGNTYRFPAVVAKMAATVDHVSNGRLILGMGAAWFELEHTAYGIPFYTPGGRARRLVESIEVIKLLLTQPKSTFNGKYYQLKDAPCEPKPLQKPHPPILIGGMGPKVIQPLAARHADIWHFFVRDGGVEAARKAVTDFEAICRTVGRDPAAVEKSTSLSPDVLTAPAKEIRTRVQGLADAGARYIILSLRAPFDRAVLRRFAKEVIPAFRTA